MLEAVLHRQAGTFVLDAALSAGAGTTLVLVGESGAGKTSALRVLAGLDAPGRSRVTLDAVPYAGDGMRPVPAWERDIGYVQQDYALFPHVSVFDNVAFGLRASGARADTVAPRVHAMLATLALAEFAHRRPRALSGGQQQRVALARALVLEPRLLLLDEPLSALDLPTRRAVRAVLRGILARRTGVTVYVTHAPAEAIAFGDRIAVLERGRITQTGSAEELMRRPRTPYVAELMGVNLLRDGGEDGALHAVDPRRVGVSRTPPPSGTRAYAGTVAEIVPQVPFGERVRIVVDSEPPLAADVPRVEAEGLREGDAVYATIDATGSERYR